MHPQDATTIGRRAFVWGSGVSGGAFWLAGGKRLHAKSLQSDETLDQVFDLVVYGGTSGGVVAAICGARRGRRVLLLEPGDHLGGLSSGGLGATDIGNKRAIGGAAREFYQQIRRHYGSPQAWRQERAEDYRGPHRSPSDDAMWTFEPRVAEGIFEAGVRDSQVSVRRRARLDREQLDSVQRDALGRIVSLRLTDGSRVRGRQFIDATYEGDLMAAAGVSCVVGRESQAEYGEDLNGVRKAKAIHHQLREGVDPFIVAGDKASGLLPGIDPRGPGEEGAGDERVQAYCLRMCVTDVRENQIPFEKPESYDPLQYELLLRNFEAGETRAPWHPLFMPNRKTDANNNTGVSTDWIGASWTWAEASDAQRERIAVEHRSYQAGLMWTLVHSPRVPATVREEISRWGNCRDEFTEFGGWSHQLYVREARRMVSDVVMTQAHCQGDRKVEDPVGLAAYTMDSHHVRRYVTEQGWVQNEGDVQVGGFPPYPISYRSIVPRKGECSNLFVPVCLSASHIAYGSIRMEPVFMVLGQSAALAADLALELDVEAQTLPYTRLRERLEQAGQVLSWNA